MSGTRHYILTGMGMRLHQAVLRYAFDGHAAGSLHGFWSILGAAQSDNPQVLRAYFDYMKTFLILSETHDGGLILQPWGRDRPNCNSDVSYGPRILPTATGAILLALGERRLQVTGASGGSVAKKKGRPTRTARPTRPPKRPSKPTKEPEQESEPEDQESARPAPDAAPPAAPAARAPKPPPIPVPPPRKPGEVDSPLDAVLRRAAEEAAGAAPAANPEP